MGFRERTRLDRDGGRLDSKLARVNLARHGPEPNRLDIGPSLLGVRWASVNSTCALAHLARLRPRFTLVDFGLSRLSSTFS